METVQPARHISDKSGMYTDETFTVCSNKYGS